MLIFLTGFMGCGKSTTGKKLAGKLKYGFIDLDDYIAEKENTTISAIFEEKGEEYFRNLESSSLAELAAKNDLVISTGGGTPCFNHNMDFINAFGISIYLKLSVDALYIRLANAKQERPLLAQLEGENLRQEIRIRLAEREPYYTKAHYKVKAKDIKLEALVHFLNEEMLLRG